MYEREAYSHRGGAIRLSFVIRDDGLAYEWNGVKLPSAEFHDQFFPGLKAYCGFARDVYFIKDGDGIWVIPRRLFILHQMAPELAIERMEKFISDWCTPRRVTVASIIDQRTPKPVYR